MAQARPHQNACGLAKERGLGYANMAHDGLESGLVENCFRVNIGRDTEARLHCASKGLPGIAIAC